MPPEAQRTPSPAGAAPDDLDHMGDAWAEDAPAVWADLRARCPVARTQRHGGLVLPLRYDDIRAAACDPGRFSSRRVKPFTSLPPEADPWTLSIPPLTSDAPHHRGARVLLTAAFPAKLAAEQEPAVAAYARELLAALPDGREIDAVRDYAHPLASKSIGRVLGLRDADLDAVSGWAEIVFSAGSDEGAACVGALEALLRFASAEVKHRIDHPGPDVVSRLLSVRPDGGLIPAAEVTTLLRTLLIAGFGTTSQAIASALHHLAAKPDLAQRLREDPGLLPEAVEELLRLGAQILIAREATAGAEVGGCPVAAGSLVMLPFGAANRDPGAFPDPDKLVFGRPSSPQHLAFGAGVHRCVGQHLARMIVRVALREWLAAVPSFGPGAGAPSWARGQSRGPERLPLAVGRATPPRRAAPPEQELDRRHGDALHAVLRLDLGGRGADIFVRAFNLEETRRTLICLHGYVTNGAALLPLAAEAARRGYRVICPDWPGRGRSDRLPPELYTTTTYAAVLRACWAEAAGTVSVVASSFGGLVAVDTLARTGTPFATAVLIDMVLRGGPSYDDLRRDVVAGAWDLFDDLDGFGERLASLFPSIRLLEGDDRRSHLLSCAERVGASYRLGCDPALVAGFKPGEELAFDITGQLAQLKGRVALVYGEHSPFWTPDVLAGIAAARPDAAVVTDFPGGHPPMLLNAREVGRVLDLLDAPAA